VVDCEDAFRRTIQRLKQVRLMRRATTTPAAAKLVDSPVLGRQAHPSMRCANFRFAVAMRARGRLRIGSPCGTKAQFARRRDSHFEIERRLSTKPHFDLVPTPIIHERHEERTS
jgi:hypothetical protein